MSDEEEEKPPFAAALRFLTERERRLLADHPAPRDLAAYHAGELSPEAEARLREHLALCRDCSDLLLDLAGFKKLTPPPGVPELTDEEMEEDWQAVQAKLGEGEKKVAEVVPIRPTPAVPVNSKSRVMPWKLLAAAFMITSVGLAFWVLTLKEDTFVSGPVSVVDDAGQMKGAEDETLQRLPSGQPEVFTFYPQKEYSRYVGEVRAADELIWIKEFRSDLSETGSVSFMVPPLPPGEYYAYLYGLDNGHREPVGRIPFAVYDP